MATHSFPTELKQFAAQNIYDANKEFEKIKSTRSKPQPELSIPVPYPATKIAIFAVCRQH